MEASFWHELWQENEIGFHEGKPNELLEKYFERLNLTPDSRIFVPLCGKTIDLLWFVSQGYRVVGAELSEMAVEQFFRENHLTSTITRTEGFQHYQTENLEIFVGDVFNLDQTLLGPVDAIYDRASLVALPSAMRRQYTKHLRTITCIAPQLMICFEYDQSKMEGPPFSITHSEVAEHYKDDYQLSCLEEKPVNGGLKGRQVAGEHVWLMTKK